MIRKRIGSPMVRIVIGKLQADAEAQEFWVGCPLDQVVKCGRKIWVSVSRNLHEDRGSHQSAAAMRSVWLIGPTSCTLSTAAPA